MEIISKHRNVRKKPRQTTGRITGTGRPTTLRTASPVTDGFLRHSFLPLYCHESPPQGNAVEKGFFASLEKVRKEYNLNQIDVTGKPYPYNILLAHEKLQQQLTTLGKEIVLSIQIDNQGETCLATTEMYNTGSTLYYIPVLPLYRLLLGKKQKRTAELLLSIFCYLYHGADIPYYRDDHTYIGNHYEGIGEWYAESIENGEDSTAEISELNIAKHYGDIMHRKFYNLYHLDHFEQRINAYHPKNDIQQEVLTIAKQAFALLQEYPNTSVFRYTRLTDDEGYDNEVIRAEQYVSFVARTDGNLYYQIEESVNAEFGECNLTEQPTLTKFYNSRYQKEGQSLDFEYRLFDLLDNLCFILNTLS